MTPMIFLGVHGENIKVNLPQKTPWLNWNAMVIIPENYLKLTLEFKGHHLNFTSKVNSTLNLPYQQYTSTLLG